MPDKGKGYQAELICQNAAGTRSRPYRLRFLIGRLFTDGIPERFTDIREDESVEELYNR